MTRRLVLTNRKGGVGKTTSSVSIAAAFAHMGFRVLLIDTDPQAHATMSLNISQSTLGADISDVALGRVDAQELLLDTYIPRLKVLPSSRRVASFERRYSSSVEARGWFRKHLEAVTERFDYVIFDTPPTAQLLTVGSLIAANEAYVPMQAHFLAMEGMIEVVELVEHVRRHYNPHLRVRGVIPTFLQSEDDASSQLLSELRGRFGERFVLSPIRTNPSLAHAPAAGETIFQHDLRGSGALDYYRVAVQIRDLGQSSQETESTTKAI